MGLWSLTLGLNLVFIHATLAKLTIYEKQDSEMGFYNHFQKEPL